MSRPSFEVADLVRTAGSAFIERNRAWIRWTHIKVLLAIARCRTAALGGHIDECVRCGHRATISYNSCRNRHCPKCQTSARERWIEARRNELLPVPYLFRTRRPHLLSALSTHSGVASEKALASLGRNRQGVRTATSSDGRLHFRFLRV